VFGETCMLLSSFLEEIELVLHGSDDEVVLPLLVVLRLLLAGVSGALRRLGTLVDLFIFMLYLCDLLFFY
jgi:hypothetical protein